MNDFTYQQSLPLRLRPSYGRHDFIVGESNNDAVIWLDTFPTWNEDCLLYTSPSPRDGLLSRMPSSA